MIGIIGMGMVGQAVSRGFARCPQIQVDPKYNNTSIEELVQANPRAVFVCVPTPSPGNGYPILMGVLDQLEALDYQGVVAVKSTVPPKYLKGRNIVYNPEFLSRATSYADFIRPPMVIFGGARAEELWDVYAEFSDVDMKTVFCTDIATASLAKYTMNTFYATKITFMNMVYDLAKEWDADYNELIDILAEHPWMGTHHFNVPGPDSKRGFGGPCLPKDTAALVAEHDCELLAKVLELNSKYRNKE